MNETRSEAAEAEADAALELIRTFTPGGVEASVQAVRDAEPTVVWLALAFMAARREFAVTCGACGHVTALEHDPVRSTYPPPRLVGAK